MGKLRINVEYPNADGSTATASGELLIDPATPSGPITIGFDTVPAVLDGITSADVVCTETGEDYNVNLTLTREQEFHIALDVKSTQQGPIEILAGSGSHKTILPPSATVGKPEAVIENRGGRLNVTLRI